MCFMGGGGGGAPQVVYRDNPASAITPPPTPPTPMASGVGPADGMTMADIENENQAKLGTSIFKINRDPMATNDYLDQGIDSGISYQ